MPSYINLLPKPLKDDIIASKCIPIIGAGFSRNADLPTGSVMPEWDGMGKFFGAAMSAAHPGYEYVNPIDAISAYEFEYKRPRLIEQLDELLLIQKARPGAAHQAFCKIPFERVFTTNVDFLLESAYQ